MRTSAIGGGFDGREGGFVEELGVVDGTLAVMSRAALPVGGIAAYRGINKVIGPSSKLLSASGRSSTCIEPSVEASEVAPGRSGP